MTSFFLYCIKKMSFSGSPKGTLTTGVVELWKKITQNPKKCSICWVSHMFSIWEYRYSYGICFGTVYALQNSTPNISTPNILSFFFPSTPVGLKLGIFYVGDRDYIYIIIYTYIYIYIRISYSDSSSVEWYILKHQWENQGFTSASRSAPMRSAPGIGFKLIGRCWRKWGMTGLKWLRSPRSFWCHDFCSPSS